MRTFIYNKGKLILLILFTLTSSGCTQTCEEYFREVTETNKYHKYLVSGEIDSLEFDIYLNDYPSRIDCGFTDRLLAIEGEGNFMEVSSNKYYVVVDGETFEILEFINRYISHNDYEYFGSLGLDILVSDLKD